MSLRDPKKYMAAAWNFDPFNACFTGNIKACDVDFIVERKGNFLVIEFKPAWSALKVGQRILLEKLSRLPKFKVLFVEGETDDPVAYRVFPDYGTEIPVDMDGLCAIIRFWFETVNV
jgi:hypothetical protein